MTVTLVQPYNPVWPAHFEQIRAFLEPGLVDAACSIEHVGSTAIPGMVAKPIIDIDIVIAPGTFPKVKQQLEALGYIHQGDLGIPQREAFDFVNAEVKAHLPEHHLYVCEEGVHELRKHLAFRNFMRQHGEWREKLNRLKQDLCVKHNNDRQAYIEGKADMVEEITKLAMKAETIIMTTFNLDDDRAQFLSRAVDVLTGFDEVVAVGVSGSLATDTADCLSDLDVCVFTDPDIPEPKFRRDRLESGGLGEITYFDADFEVSRGDGVSLNGKACDFNWMAVPKVTSVLESLVDDFDCDEFLPGGLLKTKSVYDPKGIIEHLQGAVPAYPRERAVHRIKKNISAARFSLYVLRWLEKAAARNDYFSFLKFQYELLDNFFMTLYAINQQWYCDEKRQVENIDDFAYAPRRAKARLTHIIMHSGKSASLTHNVKELKSLFAELADLSRKMYPGIELPTDWH